VHSVVRVLVSRPQDADLAVAGPGQRRSPAWDGLHASTALPRAIALPHPRTGQVSRRATGEYVIHWLIRTGRRRLLKSVDKLTLWK
jgi:hypothetical protein